MSMNKKEQIEFVRELFSMDAGCDLKINVWHPPMEELSWLLERLKVDIHPDCAHILDLYDGHARYDSPTEVVVFLHDGDVDNVREHEKLKDLYNEWYLNKQKKGGEQIDES